MGRGDDSVQAPRSDEGRSGATELSNTRVRIGRRKWLIPAEKSKGKEMRHGSLPCLLADGSGLSPDLRV